MVELDMPHDNMVVLCRLENYFYKHILRFVIFIAFPWQKWLSRCVLVLCYIYIYSLSCYGSFYSCSLWIIIFLCK